MVTVGAAQLGPIGLNESRGAVVGRLLALLDRAHERGCDLVVFPELALTTFFPRWYFEDSEDIDRFFESAMPGNETQPLFDRAAEYGIGFCLGFAEIAQGDNESKHFNTAILVDKTGAIVGKYRKVHLPGHAEYESYRPFQHLEKRYFEVGDLGFPVKKALGGNMGTDVVDGFVFELERSMATSPVTASNLTWSLSSVMMITSSPRRPSAKPITYPSSLL